MKERTKLSELVSDLCSIEVELYLDYYNGEYEIGEFKEKLESEKKNMRNIVYDLLEDGFNEEEILSEIKSLGAYYKKTPEFFGKDNDSSMYPSGYYESNKNKKYPFHEKCGHTLSLVKRFFNRRKAFIAELSLRDKISEVGVREKIYNNMESSKKKSKRKKKKNKKTKNKNKNKKKNN